MTLTSRAYKYFNAHKEESIPILISFATDRPHRIWVAIGAFSQIRDDRVLYFLIDLLRLASQKEDRNPETYELRSSERSLIRILGDYGDTRAVSILRQTYEDDQKAVEEALCKLGEIGIPNFLEKHIGSPEEILKIAYSNEYVNPVFSAKFYDWIIKNLSDNKEMVFRSHVGKVTDFINLESWEAVLKECDVIKISFPDQIHRVFHLALAILATVWAR